MHGRIFVKPKIKTTKTFAKAIMKAETDLNRECDKQSALLMVAATLTLHKQFNWNEDKICEYFHFQEDVCDECAETTQKSMIQMCSEEVGIDMVREESNTGWEELRYLNPEFEDIELTAQQYLYMRMQQRKWCRAQILALYMLTAKRKYNFDEDELGELFTGIMSALREHEGNLEGLKAQCKEEVGWLITKDPITSAYERRHKNEPSKL